MGNAGRHHATGRDRWRQVLARHRWYVVLGTGAGIAALAGAAVIMPLGHSPRPAKSCGFTACTATRPRSADAGTRPATTRHPHTARPPLRRSPSPPPASAMPHPAPARPAPSAKPPHAHRHSHGPHPTRSPG
jgi:hypothetical protein